MRGNFEMKFLNHFPLLYAEGGKCIISECLLPTPLLFLGSL